jgi:hypothetical protein
MTINNVPVEADPKPLRYIVEALDIEESLPKQRNDHEIR